MSDQFFHAVKNQLAVLRHSHGDPPAPPFAPVHHAAWELRDYETSGDRQHLIAAAAWLLVEFGTVPLDQHSRKRSFPLELETESGS